MDPNLHGFDKLCQFATERARGLRFDRFEREVPAGAMGYYARNSPALLTILFALWLPINFPRATLSRGRAWRLTPHSRINTLNFTLNSTFNFILNFILNFALNFTVNSELASR